MDDSIEPNVYKGQQLEFIKDTKVIALVSWMAPMTSGHNIVVPKSTIAEVSNDSVKSAEGFSCVPVNYDKFGIALIPEHSERPEKYGGYHLVVLKKTIGSNVKIIT